MAVLFQRIRRAHQEEAQRVARDEAFEQRLVHALQVLRHFHEGVLRGCANLHGGVVAGPVEVDQDGGKPPLGQHGGEVHGQRSGADAALGSNEGVKASELALAGDGVAGRALQTRDGIAEIGALDGLQEELVGPRAHAGNHGFAVGVEVRGDHEQIGRGLLDLLDGLDGSIRVPRDIDDQAGAGIPLQVLQHADVEVGGDLLVLRGHFGVGNVEQVVANHLPEMFVA